MKLSWNAILTVVVLSVTCADAVAEDVPSSLPVRIAPLTDVVAGPMINAVDRSELFIWIQIQFPTAWHLQFSAKDVANSCSTTLSASGRLGESNRIECSGTVPFTGLSMSQGNNELDLSFDPQSGIMILRTTNQYSAIDLAHCEIRISGESDESKNTSTSNHLDVRLGHLSQAGRIPAKDESGKFTFAFGSCSHQERFGEHQPIWSEIVKERPDCFFFIGDNIYLPSDPAAFPTEREAVLKFYCDAYDRQRRMPELQPLLRSTYCFGIWDDHDYGPNNSDNTWKWKDVAFEAFKMYFPGTYGLPDAPGCFQKFSWGDVDVFLLDDRSFRSPNFAPDQGKSMFGAAQLAWLKDGLAKSRGKVKLVVNGNQMLSDKHPYESWGTYFKPERDAFLRWLWDEKIGGVFFLAGDRHFAELIHKRDPKGVGHDVWELTSSPLANAHFDRGGMVKNEERIAKYAGGVNYGLVRVDTTVTPARVGLVVKDVSGNVVIEQGVAINK